jgi:hypothetical protein
MIWLLIAVVAFVVICSALDSGKRVMRSSAERTVGRTRAVQLSSVQNQVMWALASSGTTVPLSRNVEGYVAHIGGPFDKLYPIYARQVLRSQNGRWVLSQQIDGNLCLSDSGRNVWCNGAHDATKYYGGSGDDYVTFFNPSTGVISTVRHGLTTDSPPMWRIPESGYPSRQLPNSWFALDLTNDGTLAVLEQNPASTKVTQILYTP